METEECQAYRARGVQLDPKVIPVQLVIGVLMVQTDP